MALPRKGSRKIVVDSVAYRWFIRRKPTHSQYEVWSRLAVAVQQADTPQTTILVIEMPFARPDAPFASEPVRFVSPADVARCIKEAIKNGWIPDRAGSPFQLQG